MCGEKEILSQVKLSFNNTNGERMICTRSLQLTVKKTARSVKTLDGTLTIMRNGERSTLSTRCADLDLQMPLSLGVSAAILEYVIFCHQEESTWPLSEPAVLKKRFDEIFEALKYTKALDQIKSVRKDQLVTVKVESAVLERYKVDKERAAKIQTDSEELADKIDSLGSRVRSLDKQMSEALQEQNDLFNSGQAFEGIIADLGKFRHEKRIMEESYKDLSRNITEYEESDDELKDMQANFARNMAKQEETIDNLRRQAQSTKRTVAISRDQLNQAFTREGQLRAEAEQYEKQLIQREELIRTISRQQNMQGFDMSLDEEQIHDFKARLALMVKTHVAKFDRLKHDSREKESEIMNDLQALLTKQTERESQKNSARAQVQSMERKAKELQIQHDRNNTSGSEIAALDEDLRLAESQIVEVRAELDRADWDATLREQNHSMRTTEDKIDAVNQEISAGNRQADTRAKLGLLRVEHKRRETSLQNLINAHQGTFLEITKKDLSMRSMDSDIRLAMSINEAEVEEADEANAMAGKEVSHLEAQISVNKEQLKKKRKEESSLRDAISEVFEDPATADEELTRIEQDLEKAQGNFYQAQYAVKFYERALTFAQQKERCQLCDQGFHETFTLQDFMELIDAKKGMVPRHLANAQQAIESFSTDLKNAKSVQPARVSLKAIQEELPGLEVQLEQQQTALKRAIETSEQTSLRLQELRNKLKMITDLDRAANEMSTIQRESTETRRQISNLETEVEGSGSTRSIDEMQTEITRLQEENKRIKKDIAQSTADRDAAKNSLNALDSKRRDIQLAQSEAQGRAREKENIRLRIEECRDTITKNADEIQKAEQKGIEDQPEIDKLRRDFESMKTVNEVAENNAQRESARLLASQNSLVSADTEITNYLEKGGPEALSAARQAIESLKTTISHSEGQITEIEEEISVTEKRNNDLQNTERNINDNLRLRKVKYDISRLNDSIAELESKNAERDRDQYIVDSKKLKDRYSRLVTERAGLLGEVTQLDQQLRKAQKELDTEYKDADELYRKKLIEVRTMEKANEDLDKYGKALDNAIMKYHSLKMEEINKIVDELWKATYCGTDVDSISIKSEGEAKASNRSYNYRVCMVKGEAELDMRGRCSAGQKVLAAIIIRLALAECFGVNCGILALDEPTTNLDRENIESLAKSLANIIGARRSQKNFQLIVITHDEEFLRMMGCSDYCDYYYRVSRNEYQKSIIERQRVSTVL